MRNSLGTLLALVIAIGMFSQTLIGFIRLLVPLVIVIGLLGLVWRIVWYFTERW